MIKISKLKKKNTPAYLKGFTLVETLVAISIFSTSIILLMSLLGTGLSDIGYAKKKMMAGYFAQQGIEYVRNMRDDYVLYSEATGKDWFNFVESMFNNPSYPTGNPDFTRTLQIRDENPPDEVKIFSTVEWHQGTVIKSITFTENLFNWGK